MERDEYDVYGEASIFDGSGTALTVSAISSPSLFTAWRYDPESGNYYYRARMYSPTLGRFLQTDPLGSVDGMNLSAYVRNNPVNFIDPSGEAIGTAALAVLIAKLLAAGIDYGLTAYDIYKAEKILEDPCALLSDALGIVTTDTNALNNTTSYSYTENGKLETVTLPNNTVMKYVYNGLGQKIQQIEDLGGLESGDGIHLLSGWKPENGDRSRAENHDLHV